MKEQLQTAWNIHDRNNRLIIEILDEEMLLQTPGKKGGRTIGQQFAHMHNVRITWLEFVAKDIYNRSDQLKEVAILPSTLDKAFRLSSEKILSVIDKGWANQGKIPSFKTGLIPFVCYLISHESHHRGNILLILKQNGFTIPHALKYGIWEWTK